MMDFSKAELQTTDNSVPLYAKLVHELYQGHLPVVTFLPDGRTFWAIFEPPKKSRLYTDSQFDREAHVARITAQVGDAACQLS